MLPRKVTEIAVALRAVSVLNIFLPLGEFVGLTELQESTKRVRVSDYIVEPLICFVECVLAEELHRLTTTHERILWVYGVLQQDTHFCVVVLPHGDSPTELLTLKLLLHFGIPSPTCVGLVVTSTHHNNTGV